MAFSTWRADCSSFVPILVHEDDDAGVIAHRDQAAIDFGNGSFRIAHHRQRILIDCAGVGVEYLVEEPAHLLPPLLAELVQVLHGFVLIHEDEAATTSGIRQGSSPRALRIPVWTPRGSPRWRQPG
jgi:hypothetical protein